ncbi:SDR family oxidoreductase [Acidiphilium sp. AL]|uniref:SDR family oxidoreductase n=1 Tax=Acidiphilium sp. AL TaxID=2871704 RepID=UPI0021CAE485|nr:SDR family oxidoreductase [Acidiphilium sp. AL]MCU4158981.1 SDR family oxidoreductase [Acidiphilium sp. AL]
MSSALAGKTAIVTGGASGIGRAIAAGLAAEGASVIICGRDEAKLAEAARAIGSETVSIFTADITREPDVERLFAAAEARFGGRLDILVNNAGRATHTRTEDLPMADFEAVIAVNVTAAFRCAQRAFRIMKAQKSGRIINIGSVSARVPRRNSVPYTTSKFALEGMTRALALDGRMHGIAVSILHPGNTESAIWPDQEATRREEGLMPADQVARAAVLMATLPPGINLLDATILPLTMPLLGRG